MKKILLIASNGFSKSGVPTVFMNIVRKLSSNGFSFDIIYFSDDDSFYKKEFLSYGGNAFLLNRKHKCKIFNKMQRYISGPRYYRETLRIIKENGPYVAIHSFAEYIGCYFFMAAYKSRINNRIFHVNNCVVPGGNIINVLLAKWEKKQSIKYANTFIGCSDIACLTTLGKEVKYEVYNNPYDEKKFVFQEEVLINNSCISLVQTGFFSSIKNQLFSIEILNEILRLKKKCILHLVGFEEEDGYLKKIKKRIEELELHKYVVFHDKDENLAKLYEQCSCFLFPSRSEAFGIALVEAQATGLKCFASDVVPKSSNVGGCTYLNLSNGPVYWAKKIVDWFDVEKNKRKKYDCSDFASSNITKKYFLLYNRIEDDHD